MSLLNNIAVEFILPFVLMNLVFFGVFVTVIILIVKAVKNKHASSNIDSGKIAESIKNSIKAKIHGNVCEYCDSNIGDNTVCENCGAKIRKK